MRKGHFTKKGQDQKMGDEIWKTRNKHNKRSIKKRSTR